MPYKLYLILLLTNCCAGIVSGQIGNATISSVPLARITTGSSNDYGKSTLPVCSPGNISCSQAFTYTFIGSGNWTVASNWEGNSIPPATLPSGAIIIINPVSGGECVLNMMQTIATGASLKVRPGKKLRLLSNLVIQN